MRLHRLAAALERVAPRIPDPKPELEQYTTPAEIAVELAAHAARARPRKAADLAAGTCRLAAALALLAGVPVAAIEVDGRLAPHCLAAARGLGVAGLIDFIESRVTGPAGPLAPGSTDVVVTNPPFGVWRRGADWEILSHAMEAGARAVYAILKSGNMGFHEREAAKRGYKARLLATRTFPIPAQMRHHRSRVRRVEVDLVEFTREVGGAGGPTS